MHGADPGAVELPAAHFRPATRLFITMLREPRARWESHYWFIRTMCVKGHAHHACAFVTNNSFVGFLGLVQDGFAIQQLTRGPYTGTETTRCCATRHDLAEAQSTLLSSFGVVGILESFAETLAVMRCRVGWFHAHPPPTAKNRVVYKSALSTVDGQSLEQATHLDAQLYDFAGRILREDLRLCTAAQSWSQRWPFGG